MEQQTRYEKAKKRVEELKGFYSHLGVYVLVNAALFVINLATSRDHWWFFWPLFGWGIGVAAHAASVFGLFGLFGEEWEERKIREIMDKEERNRGPSA